MDETGKAKLPPATPLKEAIRTARIEAAERSAVVVDLRDAELARLELLNEQLEPLFKDIAPEHLDLFDRGISQGTTPRLWIDMVAHVAMGRDKRTYRLLQDGVHGRRLIAEAAEVEPMVTAITQYVARRLVAREQMIAGIASETDKPVVASAPEAEPHRRGGGAVFFMFLVGLALGAGAIYALFVNGKLPLMIP
jgi:hypothetical protein